MGLVLLALRRPEEAMEYLTKLCNSNLLYAGKLTSIWGTSCSLRA